MFWLHSCAAGFWSESCKQNFDKWQVFHGIFDKFSFWFRWERLRCIQRDSDEIQIEAVFFSQGISNITETRVKEWDVGMSLLKVCYIKELMRNFTVICLHLWCMWMFFRHLTDTSKFLSEVEWSKPMNSGKVQMCTLQFISLRWSYILSNPLPAPFQLVMSIWF